MIIVSATPFNRRTPTHLIFNSGRIPSRPGNNYCITSFWRGWPLGSAWISDDQLRLQSKWGNPNIAGSSGSSLFPWCFPSEILNNSSQYVEITLDVQPVQPGCARFMRHVSFNRWLVRYLYVPLGGRKCPGFQPKHSES